MFVTSLSAIVLTVVAGDFRTLGSRFFLVRGLDAD